MEYVTDVMADLTPHLGPSPVSPTTAALMPLLDGPGAHRVWMMAAFLLGTIASGTFGDPDVDRRAPRSLTGDTALTHGEARVLQYLPTNLSAREIAFELYVSLNTVKTHQRHLYQKLGACNRSEAVGRARALGLIAPLSWRPPPRVPR